MNIQANLIANGKGGNISTTGIITPKPQKLILFIVAQDFDSNTPANAPSVSGCNLNFETVVTRQNNFETSQRITILRAMGANPTEGQLSFSFGGQGQQSVFYAVLEISPVRKNGNNGAGAIGQVTSDTAPTNDPGSLAFDFNAFARLKNATLLASISPDPPNIPSGFSRLLIDTQDLGPDNWFNILFKDSPATSTTISWTGMGAETGTGVGCEINFKKPGGFLADV